MIDAQIYEDYLKILKHELVPALGCTEPIAVAYAAAKARQVLGQMPERIELQCSGNIIKNVKGVTVPNSNGLKGIEAAAILGVVGGNADEGLEVLQTVEDVHRETTRALLDHGICTVRLLRGKENLHIIAELQAGKHRALVEIESEHTRITRIERDDQVLFKMNRSHLTKTEKIDYSHLSVKNILDFAKEVRIEDVRELLDNQIRLNIAISDEGLKHSWGANVGRTLIEVFGNDVRKRAKARAESGSDARMSGCALLVVINSGSGNQGMTFSLPVIEYALELNVGEEKLYRALIISNLVSIHQKHQIGRLSAYCGAVSAAAGSGAGIAYLHGYGIEEISETITNTIANVGGIVCDGAKPSCAAKIASSVDAAIMAFEMSRKDRTFAPGEGLVKDDVEQTIESVGRMGREGMKETDVEILNIMIEEARERP
jgi:L-cysteine desulfidase